MCADNLIDLVSFGCKFYGLRTIFADVSKTEKLCHHPTFLVKGVFKFTA